MRNGEKAPNEKRIYNDFVIQVATVNGSGSQSANTILLKSLFRTGVPVAGKNVFPSNIAGLPTWFWIRAHPQAYQARRARPQISVAMNPQTFQEDYHLVLPEGYFFYNEDIPWPVGLERRQDVTHIPIPVRRLVDQATDQVKIKKLLANMLYVGVLTHYLGLDPDLVKVAIQDQFAGKASVFESNFRTFELGLHWAREQVLEKPFVFGVQKTHHNQDLLIIDGNNAAALGLIYGGASFASWYPITPSTSLVDAFSRWVSQVRPQKPRSYAVIQAEDELAAISMAIGAGWQGARAFTATSGPGVSLMQEAVGFAYYAEVPVVIWDVQRVGPSTGMPTRTAQGDLFSALFASHGDTMHPVLLPGNPKECFEFAGHALDLADQLQTPVFVLSDLDIGMNLWSVPRWDLPEQPLNRGEVVTAADIAERGNYARYLDENGDGVAPRALPGTPHPKAAYLTRGSGHDAWGRYTEKGPDYQAVVDRIAKKWVTARSLVPEAIEQNGQHAVGIIYYGSSGPAVEEARDMLLAQGIHPHLLRIRALPFTASLESFLRRLERIYVLDLNRDGQMYRLLRMEFPQYHEKLISLRHYDGTPIPAEAVFEPVWQKERGWS
jgi:2-oxoglutarate ferredoxin oxidoreductase subunit alpha